ncbi:MAG: S8 family serine peptidase [Bdellovibrionaceae bacterium]|nr:S8 family serine peptidase [Pseudobdellovibrionaceae bacterium]
MNIFTSFGLSVATAFVAISAQAAPDIDPSLARILNSPQESNRSMTVIVTYKNPPQRREQFSSRGAYQRGLMRTADLSQAQSLKLLQNQRREARIVYKRFWLGNSMAVTAPASVIRQLVQDEQIASVRPNRIYRLVRPAQEAPPSAEKFTYGLTKIRLPELQQKTQGTLDGRGVRVGILDTGIDASHPDLKGRTILFKDFISGRTTPYDDNNHGTHVAGTIAGGNHSGTAIGVAPGAQLIVGKIFSASGSANEDDILSAMQWMADPDGNPDTNDAPRLVSNSWGGGRASGDPANEPNCKAVDAWVKLGILPVFAAGNEGPSAKTVGLPAACPLALAVGATDENDNIARFSSRGPVVWSNITLIKPEISAPGARVLSSVPGGDYKSYSGTSMATPHVAGLAALMFQANPQARSETIAQKLMQGATDLGPAGQDNDSGWGRIDAMNSLQFLLNRAL